MFSSTRNSLNTCSNFKLTVASITRRKEGGVDRKERGKEEAGGGGGRRKRGEREGRRTSWVHAADALLQHLSSRSAPATPPVT